MAKYLVIAASGTVGSRVVRDLVAKGHSVRATTHRREAVGTRGAVETVHLDLATGNGIAAAFEGVNGAFLLSPPGYADQYKLLSPLVAEAKRQKLGKVVLMTAFGANAADTPFRRVEIELERSGLRWNVIRPNWFMQNFQTFWLQGINEQGKILLPVGKGKASFIDARDIAAVAARLLTTHDEDGKAFDLTGPESLDHDDVARILSEETGRRIVFEEIDPQPLRDGFVAAGVPADYADFLIAILGYVKQGYNAAVTPDVKRLLGREPIAFRRYARDERAAWKPVRAAA
ncbi:MAG TPA: SDR family oxidoreductase [Usitatibacter sp.]|nr:SDR family oxidoreductase [Usitatibacter sp.]